MIVGGARSRGPAHDALTSSANRRRFLMAGSARGFAYDGDAMADDVQIPLSEQLKEIGAQLDWVRGYL